jgi:hypothetical protein
MPYEDAVVGPSVEVEIRQYALSRETFDFIRAVLAQSATGAGTPFAVPPASIRGNVSNITNPSRRALGQFFAAEVAVASPGSGCPLRRLERQRGLRASREVSPVIPLSP